MNAPNAKPAEIAGRIRARMAPPLATPMTAGPTPALVAMAHAATIVHHEGLALMIVLMVVLMAALLAAPVRRAPTLARTQRCITSASAFNQSPVPPKRPWRHDNRPISARSRTMAGCACPS